MKYFVEGWRLRGLEHAGHRGIPLLDDRIVFQTCIGCVDIRRLYLCNHRPSRDKYRVVAKSRVARSFN